MKYNKFLLTYYTFYSIITKNKKDEVNAIAL